MLKDKKLARSGSFDGGTQGGTGKESACQCRRWKRHTFDPWVGKSPEGRNGNPLQYPCLENSIEKVAELEATEHAHMTHLKIKKKKKTLGPNKKKHQEESLHALCRQ